MSTNLSTYAANETIRTLAETLVETCDLTIAPILADALQDDGCEDAHILDILRSATPVLSSVAKILIDLAGITVTKTVVQDDRNLRRKTRFVADDVAENLVSCVLKSTRFSWKVANGGSVPNNYGYDAVTDGLLAGAVYDPAKKTVSLKEWRTELPANKVSLAGAAARFGFRDLADERVGEARMSAAVAALRAAVMA